VNLKHKERLYIHPFIELFLLFLGQNFPKELDLGRNLIDISDLRLPHEWYTETRKKKRRIVYHYGPTNSGKTMTAVQHLIQADRGIYCAPLRLLAWEMHEKIEKIGKKCNLVTGDDKVIREFESESQKLVSCTIEKAAMNEEYDVAVIDEIQMIGDSDRGNAWTQALLGLKADTIYLCGDGRARAIVEKFCKLTGEELELVKHQRRSYLTISDKIFNINQDLQPGDCLITFSAKSAHQLRSKINNLVLARPSPENPLKKFKKGEQITRKPNICAIIYGKLPPDIRKEQARLYNEGHYKYMVATDAIGMGLNLNIKRIIFTNLKKFDRTGKYEYIENFNIRQIGGRAGRYNQDGEGEIHCTNADWIKVVQHALKGINTEVQIEEENLVLSFNENDTADQEGDFESSIGDIIDQHRKVKVADLGGVGLDVAGDNRESELIDDLGDGIFEEDPGMGGLMRKDGGLLFGMSNLAGIEPSESFRKRQKVSPFEKYSEGKDDREAMIRKAGLFPKYEQLEAFSQQLKVLEDRYHFSQLKNP
jgi:hypothetical protein